MKREFRSAAAPLEFRADEGGGIGRVVGYAAVFNTLSEDLGGWREQIAPGAFKRAVRDDDVRALVNHNDSLLLARNRARTLTLSEDERGLRYEFDLPDTSYARDLKVALQRGDISQSSFAFRVRGPNGRMWDLVDDMAVRTILDVELYDVSIVTYPAYPDTEAALRSSPTLPDDDFEQFRASLAAREQAERARAAGDERRRRLTRLAAID